MRHRLEWLLGVAGGAFAAWLPPAVAHADADGDRYFGHHGMMGWDGWFFGPVMMVIFFALLIGAVVLIVRILGAASGNGGGGSPDRAQSILRERFARGEITKEEFDEMRRHLE